MLWKILLLFLSLFALINSQFFSPNDPFAALTIRDFINLAVTEAYNDSQKFVEKLYPHYL